MSETDKGEKRRGAGRSGTAGSIGKELGEDLDFEADALLDSLLSDDSIVPPRAPSKHPTVGPAELPAAGVLHAPRTRQYPEDAPTWVGTVDAATSAELKVATIERRDSGPHDPAALPPPSPQDDPPAIPGMPRPPTFTAPRPAPTRPANALVGREPARALDPHTTPWGKRERPAFDQDDEVTRVQAMPSLAELERMLEHSSRPAPAVTTRPPADYMVETSAQPLEELELPDDLEPFESSSAELGDSADDADSSDAGLTVTPAVDLTEAELQALADAELAELRESEPTRAPLSHTPPPPDLHASTSLWPDERPASSHLALDADRWSERAEWLENEAHAAGDALTKARTLLVASEVWALIGDTSRAREVATEAAAMARSLPLAGRQLRALAAVEQDWKAVATALDLETRGAATAEARVHAAYLNAEVHRIALKDEAAGKKKLELALRASPDDPRAHVSKLVDLLSKSAGPVRMRWPESVALAELMLATEESSRLRGAPAPSGGTNTTVSPSLALEQARKAFAVGDRGATAALVARLAEIEGVGPGALWLAASLAAHERKTREDAIGWLERLLGSEADVLARRTLAARALEQGSEEALLAASEGDSDAFRPLDRAMLGALGGAASAQLGPLAQQLFGAGQHRELAAALDAAVSDEPGDALLAGSAASRAAQALGLSFAGPRGEQSGELLERLRAPARRLAAAEPDSPLAAALELRFALSAKDTPALVQGIAALAEGDGQRAADVAVVSALLSELASAHEAAAAHYAAAHQAAPRAPAPLRALLAHADREQTRTLLTRAAEAAGDEVQSALYLLEAALRIGPDDAERYGELLRSAADALPSLSLIHRLGEQQAKRRGDAEGLLSWLRARRAETEDPVEVALDLVREALLVAEADPSAATSLLGDAIAARPGDLALRELHERIAGSSDHERAVWREQVAARAGDDERRELYAQAALEHRRAGDAEASGRVALMAEQLGAGELLRVMADETAVGTPAAARVSEALLARARGTDAERELCELYERLSKLDRARGDGASALLWQTAILEKAPHHLPALRRLEHHYLGANRLDELEPVAARLAELTTGGEADAHARLAARIRIRGGAWSSVLPLVANALEQQPPRLWALRMLEAQARAADDPATTLAVTQRLKETVERPADKATLLLRSAEAAARLGKLEEAEQSLQGALALVPAHQVVLTTLAEVLEARGDISGAARALEALADVSAVDAHKVSAWHQAAVLYLDKANDAERGRSALQRAVELDITNEDAVLRLQAIYVASGEREKLAALLERRLSHTTDPEERVALEVARGRALFDVGERAQAKAALAAALDQSPDHVDALSAFAQVSVEEGDWNAAEQALIRLVRHLHEPARQAEVYRRLGELYDTSLPNPERAELAYREVLRRDPDDEVAVERLLEVLGRSGRPEQAVELASDSLSRAQTPDVKRRRTLALSRVVEELASDRKKAEAILDKARKEAPLDHGILRALVALHQRGGEQRAATILLDRAATDARRALSTGRFDPALFEMLACVAELRGAHDAASLATATLMALSGEDLPISATGQAAGDARLDEQLAPDLITPAMRALLRKAGAVLDAAFPVDLRALKAAPLPFASAPFVAFVQNVAQSFGIRELSVLASPALGPVCLPVSTSPPVLVFGQSLLDHADDAARFFLLMRCLKVLQGHAAALSRTPPIELPAVTSAFLSLFASNWTPQGVDARKLSEAQARVRQAATMQLDDDVPVLALEVIGSLGNRVSQLGVALHQWGDRTGLLAVGSPSTALRGLALAAGQLAGPPAGPERVKWVIRNPEARDLAVFSVSEAYAEARGRLGVGR
jgi:cellulose synthase operon protein C